jgi:amino-acid N-acetyltransferase
LIGKATLADAKEIRELVNGYADDGLMLPLSLSEVYDRLRDFSVERDGALLGCCSLRIVWDGLLEIRSLAVAEAARGHGVGRRLVEACLAEARELGPTRVFALTYIPDYFARFGFARVDKSELPHKVWADCVKCPKFPDCDEVAVVLDIDAPTR